MYYLITRTNHKSNMDKNMIAIIIPVPVINANSHNLHKSMKQDLQKFKDSMRMYNVHRQKQITKNEEMNVIEQNTRNILTKKMLQNKIETLHNVSINTIFRQLLYFSYEKTTVLCFLFSKQ